MCFYFFRVIFPSNCGIRIGADDAFHLGVLSFDSINRR